MTWPRRIFPTRIGSLLLGCILLTLVSSCKKQNEAPAPAITEVKPEPPVATPAVVSNERPSLTLGIVANTHATPIVVGQSKGAFKNQQLEVTPELVSDYDAILAGILSGQLDGGMLPPGLVLATVADDVSTRLIVPFVLSRNGSSIVLAHETWDAVAEELLTDGNGKPLAPVTSEALGLLAQAASSTGKPLTFAVESPHSSANYLLRYWLAANGIYPGVTEGARQVKPVHPLLSQATVSIVTTATTEIAAGLGDHLAGAAHSEPSARAASASHRTAITGYDILKNHPSAVFVVSNEWAKQNPVTLGAVIRALHEAAQWLDASLENRSQAAQDLAMATGVDEKVLGEALASSPNLSDDQPQSFPDYQVFARYQATVPDAVHALWTLTQLVRWGQITGERSDAWFAQTISQVYRADLYNSALGQPGSTPAQDATLTDFIDGNEFNSKTPNAYLQSAGIGLH